MKTVHFVIICCSDRFLFFFGFFTPVKMSNSHFMFRHTGKQRVSRAYETNFIPRGYNKIFGLVGRTAERSFSNFFFSFNFKIFQSLRSRHQWF